MMGFRHEIITATRGNATVNSIFSHYDEVNKSDFTGLKKGKLVSMETGKTTGYALTMVEERGVLYVAPNEDVYEGMVIGENAKAGDLDVNPCKAKKLTNMRSTGSEEKVSLSPPKRMSIEQVMSYMNEDEVVEVTPKSIRLRKRILDSGARQRYNKAVQGARKSS
jgi:GTP-binding protein